MDNIDAEHDLKIVLIEAADRILPALPARISNATKELLEKIGVDVRVGARVAEVRKDGVALAGGEFVPSDLVVWAAGVKGPAFLSDLDGLESNRINQLVVRPTLQTTRDDAIFVIGDCASCTPPGHEKPIPPRAQSAHQMSEFMLKQIDAKLAGRPLGQFVYQDFGSLVSLGAYSTVGSLMGALVGKGMFIEGYFARLMYRSLYKMHEAALHGRFRTLLGLVAPGGRPRPTVKLH
jgi:NADH dehydrogenase